MRFKQGKWCDPVLPNIHMLINYLRILLKCWPSVSRPQQDLRFCILSKMSSNCSWLGLETTLIIKNLSPLAHQKGPFRWYLSPPSSLPSPFPLVQALIEALGTIGFGLIEDSIACSILNSLPFHLFLCFWKRGNDKR